MTIRNPYAKKRPRTDSCRVNTITSTSSSVAPPRIIANVTNVIQQQPPRNMSFKPPVPSACVVAGETDRHRGSVSTYATQHVRQNPTHYSSQPLAKKNDNSNSLANVYRPSTTTVVPRSSNSNKLPQNQSIGTVYRPSTSLTGGVYKERETCYDRTSHVKATRTNVINSNHHPMPDAESLPNSYPPQQQLQKLATTTFTQNPDAISQTISSNMASSSNSNSNSRAVSTTRNPYPQSTVAATGTETSKDFVTVPLGNSALDCNPYPTNWNKVPKVGSNTTTSRNPYANTTASMTTILAEPSGAATLPTPVVTHTRPPSPMNPYAKSISASGATLESNRNAKAKTASTTTILAGPNETLPNSYPAPQQVQQPTTTTLTQNPDAISQTIPSNVASSSSSSNVRVVSTTRNPYLQSTVVTVPLGDSVVNPHPYPTTLNMMPNVGSSRATSRNPYANITASTTTILAGPSGAATLPTPVVTHTRPPSPMNPYAKSMPASGATLESNRNRNGNANAKTSIQPCKATRNSTQPGTSRPPSPMNPYLKSLPGASQTLPHTGSGRSVPSSPVNPYRRSVPPQSQSTTSGTDGNPILKNLCRSSSRDAQPIKLAASHSSLGARPPLPTTTDHNVISQQAAVGHISGRIQPQPNNQNAFGAAASRSVITASSNSFMQNGPTSSDPVVAPVGTNNSTQLPVNRILGRTNASAAHSLASLRPASWTNNASQSKTQAGKATLASIPGLELPGEPTLPKEIQYSPDSVKPVEDEYRQQLVKHANLSAPLLNGWTLFSHQKRAILKGLLMRRVVMALDMGLGKTLIGCVWSKAFKKTYDCLKIFVVCPVSLKTEWQRTAEKATGLQVEDDSTAKSAKANKCSLDMKICSWAKVVTDVERSVGHYVVVCDEAHSMQSIQASRTKDVLKLVKGERCVGVLLLTGTPMKNGKPCNLFPLLKAVRHPFGKNQKEFERHFCAGAEKNFGRGRPVWDASGSSNLKQLKRLVASHLLHLTKAQCLAELPPLTRETRKVPVSSRCQLQYIQALKSLANVHAQAATREDDNESVLGAVQRLRVTCSHAKVGATVELAIKVLEQEPALVLFTSFAQVAKQVHQQLAASGWEGELLTGETPAKKRQGMVDNFQEGLSPVFVCTYGAGGVGLTLTAASTIILLDRPWTPGDTRQAEDRVRRIGQTKAVKAIWMSAFDMDIQVDDMLESKTQTSNAVLADGHSPTGYGAKISIPKLLQSLMAKVS